MNEQPAASVSEYTASITPRNKLRCEGAVTYIMMAANMNNKLV